MKILLIEPGIYEEKTDGEKILKKEEKRDCYSLSPTLPYLAALAFRTITCSVDICYEVTDDLDAYNLEDFDVIGITCQTTQLKRTLDILRILKKYKKTTVVGGPVTVEDSSSLVTILSRFAGSVVVGEGDHLWPNFLLDVENNTIKKIYKSDEPVELQNLPIPEYGLLNFENFKQPVVLPVTSSRGCPNKCTFCSEFLYGKWRLRPVDDIAAEVEYLKNKYNIDYFAFRDDNFLINPKRATALLTKLKKLNIQWSCQTDLSLYSHPELLELAIESGLKSISFGLESIHNATRRDIKKNLIDLDKTKKLLTYLHSRQIETQVNIIFGFDDEPFTIFNDTVDFLLECKVSLFFASLLFPIPGTQLFSKLQSENRIIDDHPEGIEDKYYLNYIPSGMAKEELLQGIKQAVTNFYTNRKSPVFWLHEHNNIWGTK